MAKKEKVIKTVGRIVTRTNGNGVVGLRVEAWDKDLICDDLVGSAVTDAFRNARRYGCVPNVAAVERITVQKGYRWFIPIAAFERSLRTIFEPESMGSCPF